MIIRGAVADSDSNFTEKWTSSGCQACTKFFLGILIVSIGDIYSPDLMDEYDNERKNHFFTFPANEAASLLAGMDSAVTAKTAKKTSE